MGFINDIKIFKKEHPIASTAILGILGIIAWWLLPEGKPILLEYKYMIEYDENNKIEDLIKRTTPKTKRLIKDCNKFIIGKTGNPNERKLGYSNFKVMIFLIQSINKNDINYLESYYNDKYIDNHKNLNKNTGSAGEMKSPDGNYYLYLTVR